MYNDEEGRRKVALSLTHYVYRNTELEDYHSENITMDEAFYSIMYNVVSEKLKNVRIYQRYVDGILPHDLKSNEAFGKMMCSIPEELHAGFADYVGNVNFGFSFGQHWQKAECVALDRQPDDYAAFILGGTFLQCCKDGVVLDDDAMCAINKDVHNRIYTLLVNGYFNS